MYLFAISKLCGKINSLLELGGLIKLFSNMDCLVASTLSGMIVTLYTDLQKVVLKSWSKEILSQDLSL